MQGRAARRLTDLALITIFFSAEDAQSVRGGHSKSFRPKGTAAQSCAAVPFCAFTLRTGHLAQKELSLFKQFAVFAGQTVELCIGIWYTTLYLYAPEKGAAKGERTCYEDHSGGRRQGRHGSGAPAQRGRPQRDCGGHQQSARGAPDRKLRRAGHCRQWLVHHHPV